MKTNNITKKDLDLLERIIDDDRSYYSVYQDSFKRATEGLEVIKKLREILENKNDPQE